jgi:Thiamine biosynthesis enzyme ThiH and related uncharacterized enzymes
MQLKEKIMAGDRLTFDEALSLYDMDFFELGALADAKRQALHGKKATLTSTAISTPPISAPTCANFAPIRQTEKIQTPIP